VGVSPAFRRVEAVPGMISSTFAPMLEMPIWIRDDEPAPISIKAITAPTPMTMPSVVSVARMGFLASARRAVRVVRQILIGAML
jgi:hypothetical protein